MQKTNQEILEIDYTEDIDFVFFFGKYALKLVLGALSFKNFIIQMLVFLNFFFFGGGGWLGMYRKHHAPRCRRSM